MATIRIWGQYRGKAPEVIDTATNPRDAAYLAGEYRMAYGRDWVVWAGTKACKPQEK